MSQTRAAGRLLVLAVVAWSAGCGSPSGPSRGPAMPSPPHTDPARGEVKGAPALGARLFEGGVTAEILTDDEGRVTSVHARTVTLRGQIPVGTSFADHAPQWMATFGDAFGWGPLGPARSEGELPGFPAAGPRVLLSWPDAPGCPGLVASLDYANGTSRILSRVRMACPSAPGDAARIASFRTAEPDAHAGAAATTTPPAPAPVAPHPADPVPAWLAAHGWPVSSVERPTADLATFGLPPKPVLPTEPRRAFAVRLARQIASASGFPSLDAVETTDFPARDPKAAGRLRHVELHQSAPAVDGACIDPQVDVELGEPADPIKDPSFWPTAIRVLCEREPLTGTKPPADDGRTLPKAASRTVPFLAMCRSLNFNGPARSDGWVLDRKGDIYAFSGGRFAAPQTVHQLTALVRHGKQYVGTLAPKDVDRIVELTPRVEREALHKTSVQAPDRASTSCQLFEGGGADVLGRVALASSSAVGEASRDGSASAEVQNLIDHADTIRARGK